VQTSVRRGKTKQRGSMATPLADLPQRNYLCATDAARVILAATELRVPSRKDKETRSGKPGGRNQQQSERRGGKDVQKLWRNFGFKLHSKTSERPT
jgi:hypothetical protein